MTTTPEPTPEQGSRRRRPARSPEELEDRLISLAFEEAERQITSGKASPTTINHFLKLGSTRERLEMAKLAAETEVAKKKVEVMESGRMAEELAERAIEAFKSYSGEI